MKLQDEIIKGLVVLGYMRVYNVRTKKYIVLERQTVQGIRRVFVGKNGAVRVGDTVSDSISSPQLKAIALTAGKPLKQR